MLCLLSQKYNMATSKIGEMPLQFPEVEQYFKRLQFFLEASDKLTVGKAVLLSSCGQTAFSLIETLIAPANISGPDVTLNVIRDAVVNHLRPKRILHYERHSRCRRESPSPQNEFCITNVHLLHSMTQSSDTVSTFVQRFKRPSKQVRLRRVARRTRFKSLYIWVIRSYYSI